MRKPYISITAEGYHCIFITTLCTLIFAILGWALLSLVFLVLTIFSCHFFRDPERVVPAAKDIAICPADGKIIRIDTMPDPFNGESCQRISIFMNVFNVHVNRMPVSGTVKQIAYIPGRFLNANFDKAATDNERCAYAIEDNSGKTWYMVQIAGLVARRIICRIDEGENLQRGDRFGMIKFGSRVDMYLPEGYEPAVKIGDVVMAGSTVLAKKADA